MRRDRGGAWRAAHTAARARSVPGQQEHVRRGGLPAHPRRTDPAVVDRCADPTMGHAPIDDDRSPTRKALSIDFRNDAWAAPPYNGATAYRPDFDRWLADHAVAAGATLLCNTTVTGLLRESSRRSAGGVTGVRTDRPDGDVTASVVIACDGVNSFVAKEAGLYGTPKAEELHARCEGDDLAAEAGHRRTLRRARSRGCRHRDHRLHRAASTAAGSSTPTSTRSPSASC